VICVNQAPDHATSRGFASATRRRWPACSARSSRSALRPAVLIVMIISGADFSLYTIGAASDPLHWGK